MAALCWSVMHCLCNAAKGFVRPDKLSIVFEVLACGFWKARFVSIIHVVPGRHQHYE
jgi:hypothetical protein